MRRSSPFSIITAAVTITTLWHSKPLLDSGTITKANHPGSMAQGHLLAPRRLPMARPPLVDKVFLEADNISIFRSVVRMLHHWLPEYHSRTSSATGTNQSHKSNLPSIWISRRISSAHVWLHLILVYINSAANKVTLTTGIHHPKSESEASSAASFNQYYLV